MKIFFVRHGHDSNNGDLDELGTIQIGAAANFLKQLGLDISQVRLLTSELTRAVNSAKIIQEVLGCSEMEKVAWLTSDKNKGQGIPACIAKFSKNNPQCQVLIAVSHMPEIEKALERFAKNFGVNFCADATNGSVHEVDTDAKKVQRLFKPN